MKKGKNNYHLCLKTKRPHIHKFFLIHRTVSSGARASPGGGTCDDRNGK